MKKVILIIGVFIFSLPVLAETDENCEDNICIYECGKNCSATLNTETGLLKIEGSGAMKNFNVKKTENGANISGAPWQPYMSEIRSIEISNDITTIGDGFLWGASNVTEVQIPGKVTKIGNWAFLNTGLTSVEIPAYVETIGSYAFAGTNISKIKIPDSVEGIGGYAFQQTHFLTELNIPDTVERIGDGILYGSSVQTVYCHNFNNRCYQFFYENKTGSSALANNVLLKNYTVEHDRYVLNGIYYTSFENMKNDIPVKRIYTVEEAAAVTKPTRNTFKIRYR